ncbi:retrotransposon protein [Tanacetum coccineum]
MVINSVTGLIGSEEVAVIVSGTKGVKAQDKGDVTTIAVKKVTSLVSVHSPKKARPLLEELGVLVKTVMNLKMTGCTKHMTGNRILFTSYKAYDDGHIVFGSNLKGKVIGGVSFTKVDCTISKNGKTLAKGHRRNRLYSCKLGDNSKQQICLASMVDNLMLWHRRLGHANMRYLPSSERPRSRLFDLTKGGEGKQRGRAYRREDKLLKISEDKVQASLNYKAKIKTQATSMGLESVSIRRIQGVGYGVLEFLGVGTTFDIFQNILFPYSLNTAYCLSWIRRIGLVSFVVFGECRHRYAVSSLMDTAYWLSE